MVVSLYIQTYYNWLSALFAEEGIVFAKNLLYVPQRSAPSMMDYLVRKELITRNILESPVRKPVTYMGFNRGPINKQANIRRNRATRFNADGTIADRVFVRSVFQLTTYIVTNDAKLMENIEEVYNTNIREFSSFPVDMNQIIFEQADPNFKINVIHQDITQADPMPEHGNMWALEFEKEITAPVYALTSAEKVKANILQVALYDSKTNIEKKVIQFQREVPPPHQVDILDPGEVLLNVTVEGKGLPSSVISIEVFGGI